LSAFDKLDPLVQHHIVNSVGWRSLRPLQEKSIEPILDGKHCLLLAPTAGGKTEAAMFPIFSRMISEKWDALSVIYVCPLKALLNNLHQRLSHYAALHGRRCEVWHGDISTSRKDNIRYTPPDILLTTPESLEGMLVSVNPLGRQMLGTVRIVIIDEIHSFAGDDRGWHLLSVLERVTHLAGREIQRIGLSATVGNPEQLLAWATGHCQGAREVVSPMVTETKSPEVMLDFVGGLENAALVISRLHRGEKRLVFCDSRSRVEELVRLLRSHDVETYLSHSSLSIEERRSAEKAFAESRNCVIVSTSTLELGIDVGDLDRVVQIDAPNSVASFLQRLGRTGRRQDSVRNCLLLATSEKALLKAAGLLELWERGFVEPIVAPPLPLHIFSQQLMALTLQLKGLGLADWPQWIGRLPPFAQLNASQVNEIVQFLKSRAILYEDSGVLGFGADGEARFGRRHFLEILSVFSTPSMLTAFHGVREIGQIEAGCLVRSQEGNPSHIALGGHSWLVRQIDWRLRRVDIEPTAERGRGAWIGNGQRLSHDIAGAVKRVLTSVTIPKLWSTRAQTALESLRSEFSYVKIEGHTLAVLKKTGRVDWFNFAGGVANDIISSHFARVHGISSQANDLALSFPEGTDSVKLMEQITALAPQQIEELASFDEQAVEALKFYECLPPLMQQAVLRSRMVKRDILDSILSPNTTPVYLAE
jgi:ATP-dependent helicase Lhr and Lhr-like helicase